MPDASSRRERPRFWRLQFSLTSVFVLMTLSAVGVWYWYQRPYEVENKQFSSNPDPFAAPGAPGGRLARRELEFVRRVWGGKTVRHGPRRLYNGQGKLLADENYRNGQPDGEFIEYHRSTGKKARLTTFRRGENDGPSRRWNINGDLTADENYSRGLRHGPLDLRHPDGHQAIEGAFNRGKPTGKWSWLPSAAVARKAADLRTRWQRAAEAERLGVELTDDLVETGRGTFVGLIKGQWRDGVPDGRWEFSDRDGQVYLSIDFDRGRFASSDGEIRNDHLARLLARIAMEEPLILLRYFTPIDLNFKRFGRFVTPDVDIGQMPLKDLVDYLKDAANVPLVLDVRSLEEASSSPDSQIECGVQNKPLIIALSQVLGPNGLACDFRYGTLVVTTAESASNWKDRTGVTQLVPPYGSRLAAEWNKTTDVDFVETPLEDIAAYLRDTHGGAILLDLSRLPPGPFDYRKGVVTADIPVTIQLRSLDLKNNLGMILDSVGCKASLKGETIVVEPQ